MNHVHQARKLRPLLEKAVQSLDDAAALAAAAIYPEWTAGREYASAYKIRRGEQLWRCLQGHTAQTGWEPENAASLWERINEVHSGELSDPIPYDGNMALEGGKHYIQDGVIYLCTRDTGNPVYNRLQDLVGIYVERIN